MFVVSWLFTVNGLLVAGAMLCASLTSKGDRKPAILCASFLALVWAFGCSTYLPNGPTQWLQSVYTETGFQSVKHLPGGEAVVLWSSVDFLAIVFVLTLARDKWWGLLIYGILVGGLTCHSLYWLRLVDWPSYKSAIDFSFYAEEAVFYALSGGSIADRLRGLGPFRWSVFPLLRPLSRAKALIRRVR